MARKNLIKHTTKEGPVEKKDIEYIINVAKIHFAESNITINLLYTLLGILIILITTVGATNFNDPLTKVVILILGALAISAIIYWASPKSESKKENLKKIILDALEIKYYWEKKSETEKTSFFKKAKYELNKK